MKVRLFVTEPYKDVDQNIHFSDFNDIDFLLDDAECDLLSVETLDVVCIDEVEEVVRKLKSKVRLNGIFQVCSTDLTDVCRLVLSKGFSTIDINRAIYGDIHMSKKSSIPLNDLADLVTSVGLEVRKKRLQNTTGFVEAIRNE